MSNNAGYYNSGSGNSGYYNSGSCNSGHCNSGSGNSGDCNSGDFNSGSCNSGNWNSGNWNSGKCNYGCFNTSYYRSPFRVFEQDCSMEEFRKWDKPKFLYFQLDTWIDAEDMTDQEKENNPSWKTTKGYLKTYTYKEAFRKSWDEASIEDRKKMLKCPNWNNEIFKEISGIDAEKELGITSASCYKPTEIVINGITYIRKEK